MDSDEGIATTHVQRSETASSQPLTFTQALLDHISCHPSYRPLSRSPPATTTVPLTDSPAHVLPPTPAPPSGSYFDPELPCPATRTPSPVSGNKMMALSPSPSYANVVVFSPRRQQRFTMGPRADCEKCRLGVKGHWVHY